MYMGYKKHPFDNNRYWRRWNRPVHHWMLRHLYAPLCNWGCPRLAATVAVFVYSAALHEYAVSGPFRNAFNKWPWAFVGMMSQLPLIAATRFAEKALRRATGFEQAGNVVFWTLFCFVGQPLCMLLYYRDLANVMNNDTATATATPTEPSGY
jgi:diacylglycerol O-acyltransferase-1